MTTIRLAALLGCGRPARKIDYVTGLGKLLIFCGVLLVVLGLILAWAGKANLPIGRLPGDIVYRGKNTTFYFPLATSILISVVLSLVLYLVSRFSR